MKVGDYFKIQAPRKEGREVIYEAVVLTDDGQWVSAKIVHPKTLADKLNKEGVFKIHLGSLNITVISNDNTISKAIYG